jgi:multidrug efflux pump subunit AcrA (membrane-fusion protein)
MSTLAADQAERDYKRGVDLNRNGSLPVEALERLRFRRDDAALRLSWCAIVSPLDGTVLRRYREPGEWVTPGQKILTLANLQRSLRLRLCASPCHGKTETEPRGQRPSPLSEGRSIVGKIVHIRNEAEFTPKMSKPAPSANDWCLGSRSPSTTKTVY